MWRHLPARLQERPPMRFVGSWIHALAQKFSHRCQSESTWFLRNPPLLQTIRDSVSEYNFGGDLSLCSIGCSTGAELYSVLWAIRTERRDLKIVPTGLDLSKGPIEKARAGLYCLQDPEFRAGVPEDFLAQLFDIHQQEVKVKSWVADGAEWIVGDVRDDEVRRRIGRQHIVLANNFLVHMRPAEAAACLRKLVQLVKPGGLLVCRGVDLDIREQVTQEFGLEPISTRIEEIHSAEAALDARGGWPWHYWGLEPLDRNRPQWVRRYAAIFRAAS